MLRSHPKVPIKTIPISNHTNSNVGRNQSRKNGEKWSFGIPNHIEILSKAASGNGAEGIVLEIGGVINRVLQILQLQSRDEGAGTGSRVLVPGQAHAHHLPHRHHHQLVVRRQPIREILCRVHGAPFGALHNLVEHRRLLPAVESAVVVRRPHQILPALHNRNREAVLPGRIVGKVPQCRQCRHQFRIGELRGVADGGETLVGDVLELPHGHLLVPPAIDEIPCIFLGKKHNKTNPMRSNCEEIVDCEKWVL